MPRYCTACGRKLASHQGKFCSRECHLAARHLALTTERGGASQKYLQLHDPDWLTAKVAAGGTATTIAAEVGCARATVRFAMQKYDLEPPSSSRGRQPAKKITIPAELAAKLNLTEAA